jgi:hypothetical protein
MASEQAVQFANFFAALRARSSNPDLDLPTIRDVVETMHLATKEPKGVTYAEEDAGGVEALWCIPAGSGPDRVRRSDRADGRAGCPEYQQRLRDGVLPSQQAPPAAACDTDRPGAEPHSSGASGIWER